MTQTAEAAADPVITGIGVVAPTGVGADAHWQAVLAGKSGIARINRFDSTPYPVHHAGQVPGFSAAERLPSRLIPQTDHWTHMALVATELALADAGVDPADFPEYEMAVVTSSSSGGTEFGQHEMERLYQNGPSWVSAYQSIAWFYAATTGQVSIRHGMRGPCGVLCGEQAGGLDALAQARRLIRDGESKVVVSGGTDAAIGPYAVTAQLSTGHLSTVDDASGAFVPFDADASGYLPGEGGAILIVEDAESARARGVSEVYGSIIGHAAGFDPPPGSGRDPVLRRTIQRALDDAGLAPGDIDVVFADAMGVPALDIAEAQAISEVFGPGRVPVTAPKTLTGRLYGGGASLDVATALQSMRAGIIPFTSGPERLAQGCDIDLVLAQSRRLRLRTALVLARGYSGFTSALVLGRA
ncbi:ketosynthase chain-length factor [Kibdelosporangium phytohabitans]|uniref:Beta-ketoacyl synthase n=1 Tax=Kibdelosporangium phytohabitans TaxID=860235 RepID=A0A0N9HZ26_9PSEU|nr:ketosynthase chain-length factor [Kibdelosporangium phytohabitans]ALG10915.1 beta-ketoacyl synthase [Kibdelosporangium phytohabitans]MBE1462106.1 act minimal PKS chain-length factor (CLF/KS beta) [Kibdelosporangium phytohabitans]